MLGASLVVRLVHLFVGIRVRFGAVILIVAMLSSGSISVNPIATHMASTVPMTIVRVAITATTIRLMMAVLLLLVVLLLVVIVVHHVAQIVLTEKAIPIAFSFPI
uniref:Uncharacterized protein n=1 Tax=Anopheles darlingi TaxID=43151 RepID=A0A2M4D379_ANODA